MRNWSIPVGHLFGVDFRIHLTFFFLLLFLGWAAEPTAAHNSVASLLSGALVVMIFACVVIHELAHLLVSTKTGLHAKTVILLPIGGVTLMDEMRQAPLTSTTWTREIWIALAGPLVNLLVGAIAGIIIWQSMPQVQLFSPPYIFSRNLPRSFVWCNVALALLNLIPGYPLDGGRILRAFFTRRMNLIHAPRREEGAQDSPSIQRI